MFEGKKGIIITSKLYKGDNGTVKVLLVLFFIYPKRELLFIILYENV